jgi:hypothetical protein
VQYHLITQLDSVKGQYIFEFKIIDHRFSHFYRTIYLQTCNFPFLEADTKSLKPNPTFLAKPIGFPMTPAEPKTCMKLCITTNSTRQNSNKNFPCSNIVAVETVIRPIPMLLVQNHSGKAVLHKTDDAKCTSCIWSSISNVQCKMQLSNSMCFFHNVLWSLPVNSSQGGHVLAHPPDSSKLRLLADGGSYLSVTQNVTRWWDLLVIAQGGKKRQVDTGVVNIPLLKVTMDKLKKLDPSMGKRWRGLRFGSGK